MFGNAVSDVKVGEGGDEGGHGGRGRREGRGGRDRSNSLKIILQYLFAKELSKKYHYNLFHQLQLNLYLEQSFVEQEGH